MEWTPHLPTKMHEDRIEIRKTDDTKAAQIN